MSNMGTKQIGDATYEWTPERVALVGRNAALVIAGGILLGLFAAVMQLYWVAAAIGVLVVTVLVSWQFEASLALYVLVAFVPWGQSPGLTGGSGMSKGLYVSEVMLGFLLVVWFIKYVCGVLPANRIRSGFYVPLGLYLVYCLINVVSSFLFWDYHVNRAYQYRSVNVVELGLHILSGGALVMVATSITSRKWLWYVSGAMLVAMTYNTIKVVFRVPVPLMAPWAQLLMFFPLSYAMGIVLDHTRSALARLACVLLLLSAVLAVFVRDISWVSGWLGLFSGLGAVVYVRNKRVFAIGLVLVLLASCAGYSYLHTNIVESSREQQDFDRFSLWLGAIRYASTFPLGVGLGNYRSYNSFHYGDLWGTTAYTSAHGTYAQHLSEMGFPGLVLFLAFLVLGIRWLVAGYRALPPGFSKSFVLAAIGHSVAISCAAVIGDYIIPTYHNGGVINFCTTVYSWLIWGLAVAHVRLGAPESAQLPHKE